MKQNQLVICARYGVFLWLLGTMAACSPKVDTIGYVKDEGEWSQQIAIGQTSKDEVLSQFGSPSSISSFGGETWYYVSARKETEAFFKPEVVEQQVVRIQFNQAGVVSSLQKYGLADGQDIELAKRTTPTEGHQLGFVEQILGNIGRFNKGGDDSSSAPGRRAGRGSPY